MACCTGQTECNHIITIGYLKDFTNGLIQNASGVAQQVNMNALPASARTDSYCPTYAQLTGGSLIPIFVNAGNHKWSQNVDGITIKGTYGQTQCVKQEDLVATYTRFESLTITATPSTNISECGGRSTMTYTYTLRKYEKSMNTACTVSTTSTTNTDTTDSGNAAIIYTANQTWATISKPTVTLAKNGTHDSPARTVTITGRITFRGTQHSTTATISQKALTGDYKFWYHTYELYSYDDVTIAPDYFDCNGGEWEATGYYTNHDWDVYRWQDSCGVDYNSDTVNRNHTYPSYTESYSSGTLSEVDCESLPTDYTDTQTVNYHGKTATFTQFCPSCSGDCPCGETCRFDTIHSGGTIPCTGGSVDIKYDYIVKSVTCNPSTGQRTETIVESGDNLTWATVYADGCNKTNSPITYEYDVVQEAGPCCPTADVFTYEDVVILCEGASPTTQQVTWTREHTNPDTTITITSGTTEKSIPGAPCNATSSRKLLQAGSTGSTAELAQPAVYQAAGPCCPESDEYTFDDVIVDCHSGASKTQSVGYTRVHTNPDTTKTTTTGTANKTIPAVECNPSDTTRVIQPGNTGETIAQANPKVIQNAGPCCCSCNDFGLGGETLSWAWNATGTKTKTYTAGTCISDVTADTNNNWFTVSVSNGNINVTPSGNNTTLTAKTATITVSYKAEGSACTSKTFTVSQDPYGCSCDDLTLGAAPSNWAWNDATSKSVSYTANSVCISNVTATSSDNWFSVSTSNNSITITPSGVNDSTVAKDATITVSYTSDGTICSKAIPVHQDPYGCTCDDLTLGAAPSAWNWTETDARTVSYTANSTCITDITVSSSTQAAFTASVNTSTKIITVTPTGQNTSSSPRTATITLSYKSNGSSCSKPFTVTQNANTCSCDDLTLGTAPSNWAWNETTAKTVSYTANSTCISDVSVSSSTQTAFTVSINTSTKVITVTPVGQNTSTVARTSTITVSYKSNGSNCSKPFTVTQNPYGCSCDDLSLGAAPSAWNWTETDARTVSYTANSTCITDITVSSSTVTAFTASVNTSTKVITVTPVGQNTSDNARTATITLSYKSNGSSCSKPFTVTQRANTCTCGDLTIDTYPSAWAWNETTAKTATYSINAACITDVSVSSSTQTAFTASVNTSTKVITVTPVGQNTSTVARTSTITVSYKSNGSNCSKPFTVTQNPYGCSCGDLSLVSTPSTWAWNETAAKTSTYTLNTTCISDISVTSDNNWFSVSNSVNGSNGTATVTPSGQNNTISAKTATITISYKSNGEDCSTSFTVSQNAYVCSCSDLTLGTAPSNWAWNETAAKTVSYTANSTCITDVSVSSSTQTAFTASVNTSTKVITVTPAGQNPTTSIRCSTITVSYKSNGTNCSEAFQACQNPYGCSCGDLSISTTSVTWNSWEDTSPKTVSYTANSTCITDISVSSNNTWFTPTVNTSTKIVTITPSGVNNTTTAKSGVITISYKSNGTSCSKTVNVSQPGYVCSCSDLGISTTSVTWTAWNDRSTKTITYTANSICITDVSVNSSSSWFTATVNTSTRVISITPSGDNNTTAAKTATITLSYKSNGINCSKTVNVSQPGYVCSCDDLTMVSGNPFSWAWNETGAKTGTYTANSICITDVSVSSSNAWFTATVNTSTKVITVTPSGQNTTATAKTATITLSYKSNGINCSKTKEARQEPYVCSCDNLSLTANTVACGGGSNVVIGTYNSNTCVTDLSATSNQSWISNITLSGGNIRATVAANSSTATRQAIITVTFKAAGSSCTAKTITVTQDKKCCDCDNLNVALL